MKRLAQCRLLILIAVSFVLARPAECVPGQQFEIQGAFPTKLVTRLDSKKLKAGDIVICQTTATLHTASGVLIPSGARITGHVTEAQARSKGNAESSLAVLFDKIEVAKGNEMLMFGVLQAVGPSLEDDSGPDTGEAGPGTMSGGDASLVPPPSNGPAGPNSGVHSLDESGSRPILNVRSRGVLGIRHLMLSKRSILKSTGKEVKLKSGTQMLIRAEIQVPVQLRS